MTRVTFPAFKPQVATVQRPAVHQPSLVTPRFAAQENRQFSLHRLFLLMLFAAFSLGGVANFMQARQDNIRLNQCEKSKASLRTTTDRITSKPPTTAQKQTEVFGLFLNSVASMTLTLNNNHDIYHPILLDPPDDMLQLFGNFRQPLTTQQTQELYANFRKKHPNEDSYKQRDVDMLARAHGFFIHAQQHPEQYQDPEKLYNAFVLQIKPFHPNHSPTQKFRLAQQLSQQSKTVFAQQFVKSVPEDAQKRLDIITVVFGVLTAATGFYLLNGHKKLGLQAGCNYLSDCLTRGWRNPQANSLTTACDRSSGKQPPTH